MGMRLIQHEPANATHESKLHHLVESFYDEDREGCQRLVYVFPTSDLGAIRAEAFVRNDTPVVEVELLDADPDEAIDVRVVDGRLCIGPSGADETPANKNRSEPCVRRSLPSAPARRPPSRQPRAAVSARRSDDDGPDSSPDRRSRRLERA
jgi:hypothetical protein